MSTFGIVNFAISLESLVIAQFSAFSHLPISNPLEMGLDNPADENLRLRAIVKETYKVALCVPVMLGNITGTQKPTLYVSLQ